MRVCHNEGKLKGHARSHLRDYAYSPVLGVAHEVLHVLGGVVRFVRPGAHLRQLRTRRNVNWKRLRYHSIGEQSWGLRRHQDVPRRR